MGASTPLQRLGAGAGILLLVIFTGTLGYIVIEGWSFVDSLYMTVITIATVGYAEVHPLSTAGQIFSIVLILSGVGTVFYILTTVVQHTLEGEFGIRIGRQRMGAKIKKLRDHFILCGYGQVGEAIANTLRQQGATFVVIDKNEKIIDKAQQAGCLAILGDATKDEVLREARIADASGLITAFGDDADNTYATLAARELNPTLPIIARASSDDACRKLQQAGAHRVAAPETIGGKRMARLALRPKAVELVETVLFSPEQQLLIEEIETGEDSPLIGSTIKEVEERFPGILILALKRKDGALVTNPDPGTTIPMLSSLVAFGTTEQLQAVEGCCQPSEAGARPVKRRKSIKQQRPERFPTP